MQGYILVKVVKNTNYRQWSVWRCWKKRCEVGSTCCCFILNRWALSLYASLYPRKSLTTKYKLDWHYSYYICLNKWVASLHFVCEVSIYSSPSSNIYLSKTKKSSRWKEKLLVRSLPLSSASAHANVPPTKHPWKSLTLSSRWWERRDRWLFRHRIWKDGVRGDAG